MKNNIRVNIYNQPWSDRKSVYIVQDDGQKVLNFSDGKWREVKESFRYDDVKPALELSREIWQLFIDELTNEIKPTAKAEVDAELKATKFHLEDMRKLMKLTK